jgi:hypothetical protein
MRWNEDESLRKLQDGMATSWGAMSTSLMHKPSAQKLPHAAGQEADPIPADQTRYCQNHGALHRSPHLLNAGRQRKRGPQRRPQLLQPGVERRVVPPRVLRATRRVRIARGAGVRIAQQAPSRNADPSCMRWAPSQKRRHAVHFGHETVHKTKGHATGSCPGRHQVSGLRGVRVVIANRTWSSPRPRSRRGIAPSAASRRSSFLAAD